MSNVMSTYARFPLTLVKGKGSYVWSEEGEQYLDFTSGIATCNLGHVPDYVQEKVQQQLATLWHCSNLYHIPQQERLAYLLTENSCADSVFFCNSGAEANEAAIKLARRFSQKILAKESFEIVTFKQSFHGRTMATLSATGQEKIQSGFLPLVQGFRYLPYNDMNALDELIKPNTCAVLLELVQGEGGVVPAEVEWIQALYQLCQENNILFMVDEIQTGMGRTGSLFAYQQYGIEPDVITVAKGLGSGFPIGAMLAKAEVAQGFEHGSHGSTFGGNPLACSAGIATIEYLLQEGFQEQVIDTSKYITTKLNELKEKYTLIKEVRGMGLLLGLVMQEKAGQIVQIAREKKVLILTAGPDVVRILPPLTSSQEEIDSFISVLHEVFEQVENLASVKVY